MKLSAMTYFYLMHFFFPSLFHQLFASTLMAFCRNYSKDYDPFLINVRKRKLRFLKCFFYQKFQSPLPPFGFLLFHQFFQLSDFSNRLKIFGNHFESCADYVIFDENNCGCIFNYFLIYVRTDNAQFLGCSVYTNNT